MKFINYSTNSFAYNAMILLENRFVGRLQSVDIVEQSILLDGLLYALQKKSLTAELALKGGSALQRGYCSERFSSDLDFACGKNPPFSPAEFEEFGKDFTNDFKKILHDSFDINEDKIFIEYPDKKIYENIHNDKRIVASWKFFIEIPPEISLLNRKNQRKVPFSSRRQSTMLRNDRQYVKIDICNVPTYLEKKLIPLISSSAKNSSSIEGYVQDIREIYYEKTCSLLLRKNFKYYEIFDMFFAEKLSRLNPCEIDTQMFKNKSYDQMIKLSSIKSQISNNRQFIIPTKKNIVNFLASLESVMTYDGYKSVFDSARELLIYAQDRFERCELSLFGYKSQNPWNDQENIPMDITNIADSLQIRDIEQYQKEIDEDENFHPEMRY